MKNGIYTIIYSKQKRIKIFKSACVIIAQHYTAKKTWYAISIIFYLAYKRSFCNLIHSNEFRIALCITSKLPDLKDSHAYLKEIENKEIHVFWKIFLFIQSICSLIGIQIIHNGILKRNRFNLKYFYINFWFAHSRCDYAFFYNANIQMKIN